MPMIDVYAAEGTFGDKHALARDLAAAVMKWEQVPNLALFRNNTAAFIHELPADSLSNVVGDTDYVLLTASPEGGWGVNGHANTGADLTAAARAELSAIAAQKPAK